MGDSVLLIIAAFCTFGGNGILAPVAPLVGVTAILLNAKRNPIGQALGIRRQ